MCPRTRLGYIKWVLLAKHCVHYRIFHYNFVSPGTRWDLKWESQSKNCEYRTRDAQVKKSLPHSPSPFQTYRPKWLHLQTCRYSRNEPSHQDPHFAILLLIFDWNPYLQQEICPNSEMEESISDTQGWNSDAASNYKYVWSKTKASANNSITPRITIQKPSVKQYRRYQRSATITEYKLPFITKTCIYNFDPLKPYFYIEKLGFTGGIHYFSYFRSKHRLWVLVRTASSRRF